MKYNRKVIGLNKTDRIITIRWSHDIISYATCSHRYIAANASEILSPWTRNDKCCCFVTILYTLSRKMSQVILKGNEAK